MRGGAVDIWTMQRANQRPTPPGTARDGGIRLHEKTPSLHLSHPLEVRYPHGTGRPGRPSSSEERKGPTVDKPLANPLCRTSEGGSPPRALGQRKRQHLTPRYQQPESRYGAAQRCRRRANQQRPQHALAEVPAMALREFQTQCCIGQTNDRMGPATGKPRCARGLERNASLNA